MSFGYFVEYVECAALNVHCDMLGMVAGRRSGKEVEVALGEKGVELTVCGRSI